MGWEWRENNIYYYQKERIGDTVRSEYIGTGHFAYLCAQLHMGTRRKEAQKRRENAQTAAEEAALTRLVLDALDAVRTLKTAILVASGFHTHRGQWRKSRTLNLETMSIHSLTIDGVNRPFSDDIDVSKISDLIDRMNTDKPKPSDVVAFREALTRYPALWKVAGDMMEMAEGKILSNIKAPAMMTESIRHGMETMREEMGYERAPVLERILIHQVLLTWLHYHKTQYSYQIVLSEQHQFTLGQYWEKRLSAAQRRYLRAVESLARVRKLSKRGLVQINIAGQQQVNTSG